MVGGGADHAYRNVHGGLDLSWNGATIKVVKSGTVVCFDVFRSFSDPCERGELGYEGLPTLWSMMFLLGSKHLKIGSEGYNLIW